MSQARARPADAHLLGHEVAIAAPRAKVWRLVEDPEALKQWVHGLTSVATPPGGSGGFALGATFVQRVRIGLVTTACRGEVTRCEAPARLGVLVHHPLFELAIEYRFDANGRNGTLVHCEAAVLGRVIGSVIPRRKVEAVTSELLEEHLDALRLLAEAAQDG